MRISFFFQFFVHDFTPCVFLNSDFILSPDRRDNSGTIDVTELEGALQKFGILNENVKTLMATADANGDGLIDYAEFCYLLRNDGVGSKSIKKAASRRLYGGI